MTIPRAEQGRVRDIIRTITFEMTLTGLGATAGVLDYIGEIRILLGIGQGFIHRVSIGIDQEVTSSEVEDMSQITGGVFCRGPIAGIGKGAAPRWAFVARPWNLVSEMRIGPVAFVTCGLTL